MDLIRAICEIKLANMTIYKNVFASLIAYKAK